MPGLALNYIKLDIYNKYFRKPKQICPKKSELIQEPYTRQSNLRKSSVRKGRKLTFKKTTAPPELTPSRLNWLLSLKTSSLICTHTTMASIQRSGSITIRLENSRNVFHKSHRAHFDWHWLCSTKTNLSAINRVGLRLLTQRWDLTHMHLKASGKRRDRASGSQASRRCVYKVWRPWLRAIPFSAVFQAFRRQDGQVRAIRSEDHAAAYYYSV